MKVKHGYILKTIANQHVVIPTGDEAIHFSGMLTLNESGVKLFEQLQSGTSQEALVQFLLDHYDIDQKTAENDVHQFLEKLHSKGILE